MHYPSSSRGTHEAPNNCHISIGRTKVGHVHLVQFSLVVSIRHIVLHDVDIANGLLRSRRFHDLNKGTRVRSRSVGCNGKVVKSIMGVCPGSSRALALAARDGYVVRESLKTLVGEVVGRVQLCRSFDCLGKRGRVGEGGQSGDEDGLILHFGGWVGGSFRWKLFLVFECNLC